MKFGHFDDDAREYVITTPRTPLPWINYLGSEASFSLVSHTAGGYSFYKDAKLRRITRYRYNNVPADSNGRYYYIKEGGDLWNPGWQPTQTELDFYECRHGLGYTRHHRQKEQAGCAAGAVRARGRQLRDRPSGADQRKRRAEIVYCIQLCRVLFVERRGRFHQLPAQLLHR